MMWRRRAFLGGVAGLVALSRWAGAAALPGLVTRDLLSGLLLEGSATGWRIVKGYELAGTTFGTAARQVHLPKSDLWPLAVGRPIKELLTAVDILVHETCHQFCAVQALEALAGEQGVAVFPDVRSRMVVAYRPVFPSREAAGSCPDFLRKTERYSTYFDNSDVYLDTQKGGVYGLLNELGAYYCGTLACWETLQYLARKRLTYEPYWGNLLVGPTGTMVAGQEFRGYFLAYLDHARSAYPKTFQELLGDHNLWRAYQTLQKAHEKLAKDYFRRLPSLAHKVGARVHADHVEIGAYRYPVGEREYARLRLALDRCEPLRSLERLIDSRYPA